MAASMEEESDLVDADDYYAWLGLSKKASKDEINNSFRKFSRMYHPDKHASDPALKDKAELIFTKIKRAHEVLSDPHSRAIYDTMGVKGLETDGWEVVTRTKTPQEILEEYERLAKEREQRRLEQRTNPKGTISVGIDATDIFDHYVAMDALEYSSGLPLIEISEMSISQSVECPLTTKDTAVLAGSLSSRNGRGHGNISVTGRRVLSTSGWAEVELSAGNGASLTLRGFRTLWRRTFGTMSGVMQFSPHGDTTSIRPGLNAMIATQLDKNVQGRLSWNWGNMSAMQTMIVWDTQQQHLQCALQLGLPMCFVAVNYTRKFPEEEAKLRGSFRAGTFGVLAEYGCEKKITQFSTLGASLLFGVPVGVTLKIKLHRGNQSYLFPVHLSDEVLPSAMFYGTVIPLLAFFAIKMLVVTPFLKEQKDKDLQEKKEANATRMADKKREAETAVELMQVAVARSVEAEEKKGGLLIKKAVYGKLQGDDLSDLECITVTQPVQALVKDSKLLLPEGTQMSELPGFYDPCIGEEKEIVITYEFRRQLHEAKFRDKSRVLIPSRDHINASQSSSHDR